MAQQTALQLLLIKSVELQIGKYLPSDVLNELHKAYFVAKEKFEQQMKTAWEDGNNTIPVSDEDIETCFNDYYKKVYE
jgi:hypothetical protein